MKKISVLCAVLLAILMVAGLTGCGADNQKQEQNIPGTENNKDRTTIVSLKSS